MKLQENFVYLLAFLVTFGLVLLGTLVGRLVVRRECPAHRPGTGSPCYRRRGHAGPHFTLERVRFEWDGP